MCDSYIFLFGCNTGEKKIENEIETDNHSGPVVIDITQIKEINTPLKLSRFADSISYIRLSDNDFLIDTYSAKIEIVEDVIFIFNASGVYKFNLQGKFLKRLVDKSNAQAYSLSITAFNKKENYFTLIPAFITDNNLQNIQTAYVLRSSKIVIWHIFSDLRELVKSAVTN